MLESNKKHGEKRVQEAAHNVVDTTDDCAHVRVVEHEATLGVLANGEGIALELHQRVLHASEHATHA